MNVNFDAALAFVWGPGRDSPHDGCHETPGDSGGATFGGVIKATWDDAIAAGIIAGGPLECATIDQLATVLRVKYWNGGCEELPDGVDLLLFNGRMMSGRFARLFQECCGLVLTDVDGWIGAHTQKTVRGLDAATLIHAVTGVHSAYLRTLPSWPEFQHGWSDRLEAARLAALALLPKET